MRQIKFRGKRVDNGKWAEGDLLHGVNHKAGKMFILPVRGGVMALGHGLDPLDGYEVTPSTVGQYTGLKDKNGKEIYEGDLVQIEDIGKCEVVFSNACFFARWVDDPGANMDCIGFRMRTGHKWHSIEIIGNIFDNPELLTTQQGE